MADFICFGDHICLFCEDTSGYVFNFQSSTSHSGINIYQKQDRTKPDDIPNPHAITFEVCVRNRYKLGKQYRKSLSASNKQSGNPELQAKVAEAKLAADAEMEDNLAEKKRNRGRRLRYGQLIQLRHIFTGKYVHVSTTQTSMRDKNNMMISLNQYDDKHAQFKILPRYKVKSEGDVIQVHDQVVFESVKSPGQYFHASPPWAIDNFITGSEMNLSVHRTGFSIEKMYQPRQDDAGLVRGGSVLRFFHKELEAYLTAEGLFHDCVSEDVHLRIRNLDRTRPKTMFPTSSAITYWQIEPEESIVNSDIIKWQQQVRLRHMSTRKYLCVTQGDKISLTDDNKDPQTVFRLHPVLQERDEIDFESYTRIEHVLTGLWLHALNSEEYHRRELQGRHDGSSLAGLRWDGAPARKILAVRDMMYDDAFTMQRVQPDLVQIFNYVAGIVPCILNLLRDRKQGKQLNAKSTSQIRQAFQELTSFMIINGQPSKQRQKLVRNLKIVDLIVQLLQFPLESVADQDNLTRVFIDAYTVLDTFLLGNSRKNELYFAKYIAFFTTQFSLKGDIGQKATEMMTELIRDNRKIVDRLSNKDIDQFVRLLKVHKNYRYLDLLNVLCVCDGVALPDNQTYITKTWLEGDRKVRSGVFLTDLGEKIDKRAGIIYVSKDNGTVWLPLSEFVDEKKSNSSGEEYLFLEHQLDLFGRLCFGRNEYSIDIVTRKLGYLTWEEAFTCLKDKKLPDALRAKYCDLIIGMFVDVGNSYSILDNTNLSFVYDDLGGRGSMKSYVDSIRATSKRTAGMPKDLVEIFPQLRNWIAKFLDENKDMTASLRGHNMLIDQVLRLLNYLVKFGYYGDTNDIDQLLPPLLSLLDGRNDKPLPKLKDSSKSDLDPVLDHYRQKERFEPSPETQAIVDAKCRAMESVELLLTFQFNTRLEKFATLFKSTDNKSTAKRAGSMIDRKATGESKDSAEQNLRKKSLKDLNDLMESTSFTLGKRIPEIMLDLSNYKYDKMRTKSMFLLNKYFTAKFDLFRRAVQAQVLITERSISVHKKVKIHMPILRRLANAKLSDEQAEKVAGILAQMKEFCHLPNEPDERHPMNQIILINHGVLEIVFDILSQDIDIKLMEKYQNIKKVFKGALVLLKNLAKGNEFVQNRIYGSLDTLLRIRGVELELALALTEVFNGNQNTCLKISERQIANIVRLAGKHKEKAPEFLDLLCAVVKVEELNLPLKRNQTFVMKHMMQNYQDVGYVFDQTKEHRMRILMNQVGQDHMSYLISLVDLLATCAEGENRFIESLCQTIFPIQELLEVLNNPNVDNNLKRPYLRFMLWVYVNVAGSSDVKVVLTPQQSAAWQADLASEARKMIKYIKANKETTSLLLKKEPSKSAVDNTAEGLAFGTIHYFFDAVLPFVEVFYRKMYDPLEHASMQNVVDDLAGALVELSDAVGPLICSSIQLKTMTQAVASIMTAARLPGHVMENFIQKYGSGDQITEVVSEAEKQYLDYYEKEQGLNERLNTFAVNYSLTYQGVNTVQEQLNVNSDRPYYDPDDNEALPLGDEFQEMLSCFIKPSANNSIRDKYCLAETLLNQLDIAGMRMTSAEQAEQGQVELDVKCLQLLRAMIHNEERKLPADWGENEKQHKGRLDAIKEIQETLNDLGAIQKVLPLIERPQNEIVKELLSFLAAMLFNANRNTQKCFGDAFLGTREEVFFFAIKDRMQVSMLATKERRLLAAQHEARQAEAAATARTLKATITSQNKDLKALDQMEAEHAKKRFDNDQVRSLEDRLSKIEGAGEFIFQQNARLAVLEAKATQSLLQKTNSKKSKDEKQQNGDVHVHAFNNAAFEPEEVVTRPTERFEYKDEGHIEMLLRVIAGMCDGQYTVLQDYLREQPDNIKSANLVAETTVFLGSVYSNINGDNIDLVLQVFTTLNEMASGNRPNHQVIYDNNMVDHVNFILRAGKFTGCSSEKVLELHKVMGQLVMSIMEQDHPTTAQLQAYSTVIQKKDAQSEMKDTLDRESIHRVIKECYLMAQKHDQDDQSREAYLEVGFQYYFILQRLYDIDPKLLVEGQIDEMSDTLNFYFKNSISIEILKEDILQKFRFRVKDKDVLRDEVKEKLKWNVDRSSPSNKLRDLMTWYKYIIQDIVYQKKIRSYPLTSFLINNWVRWNNLVILLSLIINVIMLVTWRAQGALGDGSVNPTPENNTLPSSVYNPKPVLPVWYMYVLFPLGGIHNLLSLIVFVVFFLSNKPTLPSTLGIQNWFRGLAGMKKKPKIRTRESALHVELFSFVSLYYVAFLGFSVAGTAWYGYFFAFHFLNIVYNNQLLQRVIQAVTQNGKSLLWVTVLGMIVIYIFALASFGLMRSHMNPDGEQSLYCRTLGECTVTVLRYGLVGELLEFMKPYESDLSFHTFGLATIFHLAFFILISTIGLNIIFGIIVDTFSELRDLKWTAENDMRSCCFICSRGSYEFESFGKGFDDHVKRDHNLWAYIFFFIHLDTTSEKDQTALELYVSQQVKRESYDFFPLNRAMVLKGKDERITDNKIEEILQRITAIMNKQHEEDSQKQRQEEERRQKQWEDRYRTALEDKAGKVRDTR